MTSLPRPSRLGKGLAALMGEVNPSAPTTTGAIRVVPIDLLDPSPFQPRSHVSEANLDELAESIRTQGILQPVLVRPHPTNPDRMQIVAGERRWRAAGLAGLHEVPVFVRELDDRDAAAAALVENLQRQDLNPIDEAEGLKRLIDDFGLTHEAMGYAVSKSRSHISNTLRLLSLPDTVQSRLRDGTLSAGHARALITHPNPEAVMDRVVSRGLSVRQTEQLVARDMSVKESKTAVAHAADLQATAQSLTEKLGLKVKISASEKGRGSVVVSFRNWAQLEELIDQINRR